MTAALPLSASLCRVRPAMGSFVALEVAAANEGVAIDAIEAGFAVVRHVEARMHPTRAGSDLAAIRAASAGEPVLIDPWTWEVLALARRINCLSNGAFDPCLPCGPGRIDGLELERPGIAIRRTELHVDLGGIAKGFAVDKAVEAMLTAGADAGIVNAGGDLRVFGAPRRVLVRFGDGRSREITLDEAALAVSSPNASSRPPEHAGYYLRTGAPVQMRPAAVVAPSAAVADALATCALLLGTELDHCLFGQLSAILIGVNVR